MKYFPIMNKKDINKLYVLYNAKINEIYTYNIYTEYTISNYYTIISNIFKNMLYCDYNIFLALFQ
jgi:hypothetical protein